MNSGVEPGTERFAPPERARGSDACEGADPAPCSELYRAPVPFQGRSLEGAPPCDGPKELARSLDAKLPADDLSPVEPGPVEPDMKFIVGCRPDIDGKGEEAALVERRAAYVESSGTIPCRRRDPVRSALGGCTQAPASQAATSGWTALACASCIAPPSFGSDPRRIMSLVDPGTTPCPDEDTEAASPHPGADPTNALDLSRTARCVSGTREQEPVRGTGFGQVAGGWNERPFSSTRANPERAVQGRVRGSRLDRRARRPPLVPIPHDDTHVRGCERRAPARAGTHTQLARPACPATHRDARSRHGGRLSDAFPPCKSPALSSKIRPRHRLRENFTDPRPQPRIGEIFALGDTRSMLDDEPRNPPGTDPDAGGQVTERDDSAAAVIGATAGNGSDRAGGLVNAGVKPGDVLDSSALASLPVGFSRGVADNYEHELLDGDAGEHELGFGAGSDDVRGLDADLSTWAPLLDMLDSTEPEISPDHRRFTPTKGVEGAHALELRAESMLQYAERGAERTGALDRTEVGLSDDNRDIVAGRDRAEVDGMLDEHTGHGLVVLTDEVEMNVGGPLTMHAHLEDNIIMAGVMRDEFAGGTLVTAAMSDDMAAGLGLRCTAPLDVWVHGLVGMEERPGTCAADGLLFELAGTLYEREYGPSVHVAAVARLQGTTVTTMKTGFRPLMKTALGVRNLIPGGGGGGGSADAAPPAAPPAPPPGGEAGAATLTAAEGGGALGRGAAGADDTDEIASVVRTVESASEGAEVEELQHPASTADNLDDLARVEVEGAGPQQVAEAYDQPIPTSAAPEPDAGSEPAPQRFEYKKAPDLDLAEPGAEGYDFRNAYDPLRDRVEFYRGDSNWRGNLITREHLQAIDAKAMELFEGLGGNAATLSGDSYGYRTSNIYAAMEEMAQAAEQAEDLEQLARIQDAMTQLEEFVQGQLVEVAARTDEFAGTALGSQRMSIDPNIDTQKLRAWLAEQKQAAFNAMENPATPFADMQQWSWTHDYYDQLIKTLDAGMNPLAESSEQISFVQITKVDKYYANWPVEHADEIAEAAAEGYVLIPPRPEAQNQVDVFVDLHDGLLTTLSDPEFFRSADEMGLDAFPPPVRDRIEADAAFLGPDSLGSPPAREAPSLDFVAPGTEGYDFAKAYGSLDGRNQFYREEFNFRGNFFMREYLHEIDAQAFDLFTDVGGAADAIQGDNFGNRTSSIYRTLQEMATQADEAGDVGRADEIRDAIARLEGIVNSTLTEVAARTDEFSGAALGSQRAPIDPNIDKVQFRGWLQGQLDETMVKFDAATTPEGMQVAIWERGYYEMMIRSLDEGVNPLAVSNEQIAVLRINQVEPYYAQFADEAAAAAAEGYELVIPRPRVEDEVDLYVELQKILTYMLSDPSMHRSAEAMGDEAFTAVVRSRIGLGVDFLGPNSLRPVAGGDIPPPLPAADLADSAVYVGEVRDRSFARSALAVSEEALERQAAGLARGDASVPGSASVPDTAPLEPSLGSRRAPPDGAQAPVVDEQSGRWALELPPEPGASSAPAQGPSTPAYGDAVTPQASDVSWESGLRESGGSEFGPAAGSTGDPDASDIFKTASEPEDVNPTDVDEAQHAPSPNDDGASGTQIPRLDGTEGEDANPTGAVSEPGDSTAVSSPDDGAGPGRSGTTSPATPDTPDLAPTGAAGDPPGADATPGDPAATDADAGTATRTGLYDEPGSFEGRSLEGAPGSDNPKELAQSLDGAEVPVEDLPRVDPDPAEPASRSILKNSDGRPVSDTYRDVDDAGVEMHREWARYNRNRRNRGGNTADSVWAGDRGRAAAVREANARWSEFAATHRTSSTTFSDDPRQLLYQIEYEGTRYSKKKGKHIDRFRGADPPNTIDRAHAAHYVPRPRGWESTRETGFGRLSQGWNEFPFSPRERIVNSLQRGEALSPDQIISLELGLESYRAAGGELSSSQYRAMVDMISELGDQYRHTRWHVEGESGERLRQLVEMLDHAAGTV